VHSCGHAHHQTEVVVAIDLSKWTAAINKIAKDLFKGKLKPKQLNNFLVNQTFSKLEKGAAAGYGKDWIKFDPINSKTVQQLRSNLYLFSGVKTYQQLTEMNSLLVDKSGKIRNWNAFKKEVFKVHKKYNRNYLQAEYQTAKASAQMARKWQDFEKQKHLYPNLVYKTVGDDRVRQEHADLNGIIKPIDDAFWDVHYPPNGWRCRCTVTSTKKEVTQENIKVPIDKRFTQNVGKTKKVFNQEQHPYFSIPVGDKIHIEKVLEKSKLAYPQYKVKYKAKSGAKVSVSAFADASDLFGNYRAAIKMADTGIDVKIRPHIEIENAKNAEYLIDGVFADRAALENFNNLSRVISDKKAQCLNKISNPKGKQFSVVFDLVNLKSTETLQNFTAELNRSINKNRGRSVKSIIVINKGKVVKLSRADIVKRNYTELYKIQ